LIGRYWQRDPGSLVQTATTLKDLGIPITQTEPPTATFISPTINYQGGNDLTPLGDWLGADAASLVGGDPAVNNMDDGLISWTGYYGVAAAGTLNFRLASDDGSILTIGGVTVVDNDGGHGAPGPSPNGSATFTAAGLYPVEITWFNGDWTDPNNPSSHGGANIAWRLGSTDGSPLVATASLYTVPEPSSLVLVALGGLAALAWMVRRRR
jgi:hypothetical protein